MLVCHCKGLSDREVRATVREGASTRRQVTRACGAGSVCGGCRPVLEEIVAQEAAPASGLLGALDLAPAS